MIIIITAILIIIKTIMMMVFMFGVHSIYQVSFELFICVTPFNLQNNPMR